MKIKRIQRLKVLIKIIFFIFHKVNNSMKRLKYFVKDDKLLIFIKINLYFITKHVYNIYFGDWGLGIGDWGLGDGKSRRRISSHVTGCRMLCSA